MIGGLIRIMTKVVEGWTSFENVDAIKHVWCPWCGVEPGKLCVSGVRGRYGGEEGMNNTVKVHGLRALHFRRWANMTKFVPNHLIGENDKDLSRASVWC